EADISEVTRWAWQRKLTVLLPKTWPEAHRLTLHCVLSFDELVPGTFGIMEPGPACPEWDLSQPLDIMLIPGLAFDKQGGRVGYGGGYYDRLLEAIQAKCRLPKLIAPAFDFQLVEEVPMEQ